MDIFSIDFPIYVWILIALALIGFIVALATLVPVLRRIGNQK